MAEARGRPLWLRWRSRRSILHLQSEVQQALAVHDIPAALVALDVLAGDYHWHGTLETLLFRRASRPQDQASLVALLHGIARGSRFRRHHRAYALVSLAYRAAACGDGRLAEELRPSLEAAIARLDADPGTLHCQRRNRENRLKMLISSKAALAHVALLQNDWIALDGVGSWAHRLLESLDFDRLPADVTLRLMSNFGRCLALQAPRSPGPLRTDLERLAGEAARPRHRHSRAHEDHLAFVLDLVAALEREAPIQAILNEDTPLLRDRLQAFWQAAQAGLGT